MSDVESDAESVVHDDHSIIDPADDYRDIGSDDEPEPENVDWGQRLDENVEEFELLPNEVNSELGITHLTSPLDILRNFITNEIINNICLESQRYAQQSNFNHFQPFEIDEFWRFMCLQFTMGIVRKSSVKDYWTTNKITQTPFFGNIMPRDRYIEILRSLHFVDNEQIPANNTDKFIKLGPLLNDLIINFKRAVHPGEYLCLDESLVPFHGRLSIKQYNPKKRARFGVKLFVLADCASKMIIDILPYQGASTKLRDPDQVRELGFGGAAVMTLLHPYLGLWHKVVVDNYFNSPTLARKLKRKQTYVLGTVQKRRKGMPKGVNMTQKLKRGEVRTFSDGGMLIERWSDRRDVCMLNSFIPHSMVESESVNPRNQREKPATVLLYNSKMGAVDDCDKVVNPHASFRKTRKWYRKIAFHLFDIAVYNSFLIYCRVRNVKMSYVNFVKILVQDIVEKFPPPARNCRGRPTLRDEVRLSGRHFPALVDSTTGDRNYSRSNCVYCLAVHGKRKQVKFRCNNEQCQKRLCVGDENSCFIRYHTEPQIRKHRSTGNNEN